MAINTVVGHNLGFGLVNQNFDDVPALTEDAVVIIKKYEGNVTKTWKKGRDINGVTAFEEDIALDIRLNTALDLENQFATELPDAAVSSVFFLDNGTGSASAYSAHTPDTGTATASGTITLDGNGHIVFESANAALAIQGGTANRKVTLTLDAMADNEAIGVIMRYTDPNYTWTTLTRSGSNLVMTIQNNATIVQTATFAYAANIVFVSQVSGNVVTATVGSNTLNYTTSIAGNINSVTTPGGVTISSVKAENV